jgi:hypothetical protein
MAKLSQAVWLEKYFSLKINIQENGVIIKGVNDPETLAKNKTSIDSTRVL